MRHVGGLALCWACTSRAPTPTRAGRGSPQPGCTLSPEGRQRLPAVMGAHYAAHPQWPHLETSRLSLKRRAVAAVIWETDALMAAVNKAGEGGDCVTPVKYGKINTRMVGILQVN